MPRRPTSISTVSVTGPSGPWTVVTCHGRLAEQVAQPAQLVGVVPVHPHARAGSTARSGARRTSGRAACTATTNSAMPYASMSRLLLKPEVALDVDLDPQALAVEAVLPALVLAEHRVEALEEVLVGPAPGVVDAHRVVGRDRAVEEAPARPAGVLGAQPRERRALPPAGSSDESCSMATRSGRVGTGRNIGRGPAILPAMQPAHETLARGRSPFAAAFLSLLFPGLGHAYLGAYRRGPRIRGAAAPARRARRRLRGPDGPVRPRRPGGPDVVPDRVFVAQPRRCSSTARTRSSTPGRSRRALGRPAGMPPRPRRARRAWSRSPGLAAVLLVMSGVHVAVARYDLLARRHGDCIFDPEATDCDPTESPGPGRRVAGADARPPTPEPTHRARGQRPSRSRRGTARSA